MLNFLFDLIAAQPNLDGKFHGGGKYAKKILLSLISNNENKWRIYCLIDSSISIDQSIEKLVDDKSIILIDIKNYTLKDIVKQHNISRIYSALPLNLIRYGILDITSVNCSLYGTIHGLRPLEIAVEWSALNQIPSTRQLIKEVVKKLFYKKLRAIYINRYKQLFYRGNIIAVSNHTKYALRSYMPGMNNEIKVFYSPDVTEIESHTNVIEKVISNYFLLVSGNRWLKNNVRSMIALDNLFSENPNFDQRVIITGVNQKNLYLRLLKNKERFIFYDYVSESQLSFFYKNAFAFLYMSLNEGFGYPPLEAMKFGIPVITSPFTSITEICGDAVLYSNPYSIFEIKNRILQLYNKDIYNNLSDNGRIRYEVICRRQRVDLKSMVDYLLL